MSQSLKTPPKPEPKQLEFRFRTKSVAERSVWESWAVLPAKTRLGVSIAITVFAAVGLLVSDQLEKVIPAPKETKPPTSPSSSS